MAVGLEGFVGEVVFGLESVSKYVGGKEDDLAYHYFAADEAFEREGGEHVEAETPEGLVSTADRRSVKCISLTASQC